MTDRMDVLNSLHIIADTMERQFMTRNVELDLRYEDSTIEPMAIWARRWSQYCQDVEQEICNYGSAEVIGKNPNWMFKGNK